MSADTKPYEIHIIGQRRTVRAIAPAGWYALTKDGDKDRVLHLPVDSEVNKVEKFVMKGGVGRWIHNHYEFETAVPKPSPPKSPGLFVRLWARLRRRRLPRARALPAPKRPTPSTVAEALDEWSGW